MGPHAIAFGHRRKVGQALGLPRRAYRCGPTAAADTPLRASRLHQVLRFPHGTALERNLLLLAPNIISTKRRTTHEHVVPVLHGCWLVVPHIKNRTHTFQRPAANTLSKPTAASPHIGRKGFTDETRRVAGRFRCRRGRRHRPTAATTEHRCGDRVRPSKKAGRSAWSGATKGRRFLQQQRQRPETTYFFSFR